MSKWVCTVSCLIFILSCGPGYVQDPNAYVMVTSQYENEDPRIILSEKNCRPQVDCNAKTKAECVIAFYVDSQRLTDNAKALIKKRFFLSARVELMQALCRLYTIEINLKSIKTDNFKNYKAVMKFNLEEKTKKQIKICDRLLHSIQWR